MMEWLGGLEDPSPCPCQKDNALPLSLQHMWCVWRLPKGFRDMLPEPPQPLSPIDLDFILSTTTHTPSINLAHLLTESKLQALSFFHDEDTDGSISSPTVGTLAPRPHQIHQTQLNLCGLFWVYDKESLPTYDHEDTTDDSAVSWPATAWDFIAKIQQSTTENPFYLYPNESSLCLGDWYWNQSSLKSKDSFKWLLDIIGSPSFQLDNVQNTKWASIDHILGAPATDDDQCLLEWLHNDAGWMCIAVTISVLIPDDLQILAQQITIPLISIVAHSFPSFVNMF